MVTPTREAVRSSLIRKLRLDTGLTETPELPDDHSLLAKVKEKVIESFNTLDARICLVEYESNRLKSTLEVSKKIKFFDRCMGPMDTIKVMIDGRLHFTVYIFAEIHSEGDLSSAEDIVNLVILQKMQSCNICIGISDYSFYKSVIRYHSKNVVPVNIPSDTARHLNCEKIVTPPQNVCKACTTLKWYLNKAIKRKHDGDDTTDHLIHQQASSVYRIDYLSPASKKARLSNLRNENRTLKAKIIRLQTLKEGHLKLCDEQSQEMSELVSAITSSEIGRMEVKKIFEEAESYGEDKGVMLRNLWDEECSFSNDQLSNETGKKGNRWSPITIRLSLAVYSRSPSAFNALRSLHLLQLPCERTMKKYMNCSKKKVGIVPEDIQLERDRYMEHKAKVISQGKLPPLSQGVLIWDESKIQSRIVWNSRDSSITGFAMSSEEL